MVMSSWRLTWRYDVDRVVDSMSRREREVLRCSDVRSTPGRRVFVNASERLEYDVVHCAYLMEQAGLALNEIEANSP